MLVLIAVRLQHHPHLLGDRLELVVEDLEEDGVDARVGGFPVDLGFGVLEDQVVALVSNSDEAQHRRQTVPVASNTSAGP